MEIFFLLFEYLSFYGSERRRKINVHISFEYIILYFTVLLCLIVIWNLTFRGVTTRYLSIGAIGILEKPTNMKTANLIYIYIYETKAVDGIKKIFSRVAVSQTTDYLWSAWVLRFVHPSRWPVRSVCTRRNSTSFSWRAAKKKSPFDFNQQAQ